MTNSSLVSINPLCKIVKHFQQKKLKQKNEMSLSVDLEHWMTNLPPELRDVAVINLAIPGSHDSATYGISKRSKLAPDAEDFVRKIYPFVPCIVRRWARTQKYSIAQQLNNGIRYFDLRCSSHALDEIYFVHGLFCERIVEPFKDLLNFLNSHPGEFVILDFQHFYDFTPHHHEKLIEIIKSFFQTKIFERSLEEPNLSQLTLSNAYTMQQQVIIIYRHGIYNADEFFRSYDFPTPWPNETKVDRLKTSLSTQLQRRSPDQGFVLQCILTPDAGFILPRFYSTLRKACAKKVDSEMTEWIKQQMPGKFVEGEPPTANVFLMDFIDLREENLCRTVIGLNSKLLNDIKSEN